MSLPVGYLQALSILKSANILSIKIIILPVKLNLEDKQLMLKIYLFAKKIIDWTKCMSLDFILIPSCIIVIIYLLNRENRIYKKNQNVK